MKPVMKKEMLALVEAGWRTYCGVACNRCEGVHDTCPVLDAIRRAIREAKPRRIT
jgi:hypothetical protein